MQLQMVVCCYLGMLPVPCNHYQQMLIIAPDCLPALMVDADVVMHRLQAAAL
jgi:hypothetical protein